MATSEITPIPSEAPAGSARPLGVYVHVPFCASTCDFCAFYQTTPTADGVEGFLSGIAEEANLVEWPRPVTTVFWGGGTPGLLAPDDIRRLGAIVQARLGADLVNAPAVLRPPSSANPHSAFPNPQSLEWTVEMAPASVTDARLAALKEIGVTRISMGVQSFQPALLDALGRQHTLEQVMRAYGRIRTAGFASVNLDLMFALPGQTEAEWIADIEAAVALAPDHLSTYCLTFEEDTKLWIKLSAGRVKLDLEHEARLYETTWARLAAAGYEQYEVSNFARPGHACRHNLNTWHMHEWIGLGPSAASQHAGFRGGNIADLVEWRARVARGERLTEDRVALTPALLLEDSLIFGLRMNAGVDLHALRRLHPVVPWGAVDTLVDRLVEGGVAQLDGGRLRLSDRGRLIADAVGAEVMEAMSEPVSV